MSARVCEGTVRTEIKVDSEQIAVNRGQVFSLTLHTALACQCSIRSIWNELRRADEEVKQYLKERFGAWLQNAYINEWIAVHLVRSEQKRLRTIIGE